MHRPLQGGDDRNPEIAEQARKIDRVRLHPGSNEAAAELRQEKILDVDDCTRATIAMDALDHGVGHQRYGPERGSMVIVVRTSEATSASTAITGATTL